MEPFHSTPLFNQTLHYLIDRHGAFFLESHSTMKTPTTRTHTHTLWIHVRKLYPYEHLPPRADPCVDAKHLIAPVRQSSNLPQGKQNRVVNLAWTGNFTGLNWSNNVHGVDLPPPIPAYFIEKSIYTYRIGKSRPRERNVFCAGFSLNSWISILPEKLYIANKTAWN